MAVEGQGDSMAPVIRGITRAGLNADEGAACRDVTLCVSECAGDIRCP